MIRCRSIIRSSILASSFSSLSPSLFIHNSLSHISSYRLFSSLPPSFDPSSSTPSSSSHAPSSSTVRPPPINVNFIANSTSHPLLTVLSIDPSLQSPPPPPSISSSDNTPPSPPPPISSDIDLEYLEKWQLLGDWLFGGQSSCQIEIGERELNIEIEKGRWENRRVKTLIWSGELSPLEDFTWKADETIKAIQNERLGNNKNNNNNNNNNNNEEGVNNNNNNPNLPRNVSALSGEESKSSLSFFDRLIRNVVPPSEFETAHSRPNFFQRFSRKGLAKISKNQNGDEIDGFCSIISPPFDPPLNLYVYDFISATIGTDNRPYLFHIRTHNNRGDTSYVARINSKEKNQASDKSSPSSSQENNSSINNNNDNNNNNNDNSASSTSSSSTFNDSSVSSDNNNSDDDLTFRRREVRLGDLLQLYDGGLRSFFPPLPKHEISSFGFSVKGRGKFRLELALIQAHQGQTRIEREKQSQILIKEAKELRELKEEIKQVSAVVENMTFDEEVNYYIEKITKEENLSDQQQIDMIQLKSQVAYLRLRRRLSKYREEADNNNNNNQIDKKR